MAPNRITRGGAMRRGRAGALATFAALTMLALLAGCGGGGSSSTATPAPTATVGGTATNAAAPTPSPEEAADAALLDLVLGREEAATEAFGEVGPQLPPGLARTAAYFRAQEQEHVDAVLRLLRGQGSPAEPSPEPIDTSGLNDTRERLLFLYEVEGATIDKELKAIAELYDGRARSQLASIVANQAQHLTLLRRALGAGPLAQVPVPFEKGTTPPPEGP